MTHLGRCVLPGTVGGGSPRGCLHGVHSPSGGAFPPSAPPVSTPGGDIDRTPPVAALGYRTGAIGFAGGRAACRRYASTTAVENPLYRSRAPHPWEHCGRPS